MLHEHCSSRPFLLRFIEVMPPMIAPGCVYDPREQRCITEHPPYSDPSTQEYSTGYTPWTGQEDKD